VSDDSVIWHTDVGETGHPALLLIGGKALGLHELRALDIEVPPWATLTTRFCRQLCAADAELAELLAASGQDSLTKATLLRAKIAALAVNDQSRQVLLTVWDRISARGASPVAVRSSAADEDSRRLSFAGQMDSFLNLKDSEKFITAFLACLASFFGDRAVCYRQRNRLDPWSLQMAVIVQQLVEPEVSGVIFTTNPVNGNPGEMLISSTWGLGEGLVAGSTAADTFVLGTGARVISSDIAVKDQVTRCRTGSGTILVPLTGLQTEHASLNRYQLQKLYALACRVRDFKAMPMDLEFALKGETVYLLQARPVTGPTSSRDNYTVWDNSNIVESYAGVTTPLTFTFIKRAYAAVYWQFCEVIGVDQETIFRKRHLFENMLGLIEGRVYYNLLNWYRLIAMMPGFKYNKTFMEQMMGVSVVREAAVQERPAGWRERFLVQLPKLLKVGIRMAVAHLTLPARIERFHRDFRQVYSRHAAMDFDGMTPAELCRVYETLESELLWRWKAPILNDFEAMIFYGLLQKLTERWDLGAGGMLPNDLLCGEGGIRSTSVVTELFCLARKIEQNAELKAIFLAGPPEEVFARLRSDESFAELRTAIEGYLENYGARAMEEMKLESSPLRENPALCLSIISNYLAREMPDPEAQCRHEQRLRSEAEQKLAEMLHSKHGLFASLRLPLYRWVLHQTRNAVKNRENQRFARAEAYNLVRRLFRAIGRNWQHKGILDQAEDIFYLEMDEIWSYIKGTCTCPNFRALAALRHQEFESYRRHDPADHLETSGEVYFGNSFARDNGAAESGEVLNGLGCCRGIVEKPVRIVLRPAADLKLQGEIMVARQTDPGWIFLFPSVSGLIIEKGSMLSHSAIVAREMGIPAVVGVAGATTMLRDGDLVRLDGAGGEIRIMKRKG
jgi:rifampicin phosphotransferase